ncbi:MAG TPA: DUF983 domain-containing protein [Thermoanaerobaculia bacterium]|nr:DUF983 domain-containing protein [Thermoanaerobaculia bacterium]
MASPAPDPPPVLPWRGETARRHAGWPKGYWRTVVWRGLRLRCPVCGQGRLFQSYFRMRLHCPCCGVGFAREDGQWVGSLDINTFVVAFGLMIASAFSPEWPLPWLLAVWGAAAIAVPLVTFRFARGLWTAIVHLSGGVY